MKKRIRKDPLLLGVIVFGSVLLISAIVALIFVADIRSKQAQEERTSSSSSSLQLKQYQGSQDSDNTGALSPEEAMKNIYPAIKLGFKEITDNSLLSGIELEEDKLAPNELESIKKYYASLEAINSFNATVNMSTAGGYNIYGQTGHIKIYKTVKQGATYTLKSGKINYRDATGKAYVYVVQLVYEAGGYQAKLPIIVQVDKDSGKIILVENKVEGDSNG